MLTPLAERLKVTSPCKAWSGKKTKRKRETTMTININYNYREAVTKDVKTYITEEGIEVTKDNKQDLSEELYDGLWIEDSVTGNASGSYTFCRQTAKEYVFADMDTVTEALAEFCVDSETVGDKFIAEDWEWFDVTARCYVLGEAIEKALCDLCED